MRKYRNILTTVDGITFDSKKEANRYCELKLLEKSGRIKDLKLQVKFELIPKIEKERACFYVADFTYLENGKLIVEDCKGHRTEVYKLKRKLMLYVHNIRILET